MLLAGRKKGECVCLRREIKGRQAGTKGTHPVGGEDDELVLAADPPLRHLRHRDDAVVLDAVVAERARHGEPRRLPAGLPDAVHAGLVGEAENLAVAPPDALLLLCTSRSRAQRQQRPPSQCTGMHAVTWPVSTATYVAGWA